jgi:dTDP-4-amino-4,6-dideoxygalactose transaminase
MHLQPVFGGCRTVGGRVAAGIFETGLCLPSGSSLTPADRDRVVEAVLSTPRHV